jgi:hypothetical protein
MSKKVATEFMGAHGVSSSWCPAGWVREIQVNGIGSEKCVA